MHTQPAANENPSSAVTPAIRPRSDWRLRSVEALDGYRLNVTFNDGLNGLVDLSRLIHASDAGVFAALADPAAFSEGRLEYGAVTWPCGIDLAPDAMHRAIQSTGRWTL